MPHPAIRRLYPVAHALCFLLAALWLAASLPPLYAGQALAAPDKNSPAYALHLAQSGIDKSDSDLFNQGVDVPEVVIRASDALLAAMREQAAQGEFGGGNLGLALSLAGAAGESGQADFIKQLLVSEVRGFVVTGINGGYFAGTPDESVRLPKGSLASALKKIPQGRREIIPGPVLSQKGDSARMKAEFSDPKAGRLPLELLLERRDGNWRVVEIANAESLFKEAARRAK